jgi:hypothetical protein
VTVNSCAERAQSVPAAGAMEKAAESKGRFFADHIRSNTKDHPHTLLPDDEKS